MENIIPEILIMSYIDEHNTWNHSLVSSMFCIIFKNKIHVYGYTHTLHDTSYLSEQQIWHITAEIAFSMLFLSSLHKIRYLLNLFC